MYILLLDKPENFQFAPSKIEVCQDIVINFTCSADGKPAVKLYQLFENDTLVTDGSNSHGMWNKTMSTGGVFAYKCVAINFAGTGQSESVTVIVKGKQYILYYTAIDYVPNLCFQLGYHMLVLISILDLGAQVYQCYCAL